MRFKPYSGIDQFGNPCIYACSTFDETDLQDMLDQPRHLQVVDFQTGHQIHTEHLIWVLDHASDATQTEFIGAGFVKALASLGYRIVPEAHEIEFLNHSPRKPSSPY